MTISYDSAIMAVRVLYLSISSIICLYYAVSNRLGVCSYIHEFSHKYLLSLFFTLLVHLIIISNMSLFFSPIAWKWLVIRLGFTVQIASCPDAPRYNPRLREDLGQLSGRVPELSKGGDSDELWVWPASSNSELMDWLQGWSYEWVMWLGWFAFRPPGGSSDTETLNVIMW